MTTDTAVRVTRMVVQDRGRFYGASEIHTSFPACLFLSPGGRLTRSVTLVPVEKIPYVDFPELKFSEHESTEMPFRYVKGDDGTPIMPAVSNYQAYDVDWTFQLTLLFRG